MAFSRLARAATVVALLPFAAAQTVSDAILCEAVDRLGGFEDGTRQMGTKKEKDGVDVFFSGSALCGGRQVPIFFANWSLPGVKPIHVFAAIADVQRQQWTGELARAQILTEDLPVSARGAVLQYEVGALMSDRKVHEWETYSKSADGSEYWFAASSKHNGMLKQLDPKEGEGGGFFSFQEPVECDSCLSAHHIVATKDGVRGSFTTNVNGHPPLGISPTLVTHLTWGKSADFVTKMKARAVQLAQLKDESDVWEPPARLMASFPPRGPEAGSTCQAKWKPALAEIRSAGATVGLVQMPDDDEVEERLNNVAAVPAAQAIVPAAIAACCLALLVVANRRRRTNARTGAAFAATPMLLATEASATEAPTLSALEVTQASEESNRLVTFEVV